MMRPLLLTVLLSSAALYGAAAPAFAQKVQRCTTMSGETVYTDKRCEDIGAMDRLPQVTPGSSSGSGGIYRAGCSRTLSDLVYQITSAVENKDVNRLASVYQWTGVSNAAANSILDKLQAVVDRPLVDIVPVRPQPPPIVDADGVVIDDNSDGYYPQTAAPQRPIGLRLEQTLKNGSTPSRTVFGLHRSYNCFWISL
ncbi:hypothetical protein [Pseudoxanthomonas sp. CF125]|uniref:hypothetical protein n=1 Tax=Pseudoxanthomonas sp. CF125 TaxID=1855303 RepID=UPI000889C39F|nr:hypothetical protein [Pseudoxanthomonas sp. CF125]SDQ55491.1 hypothetical protein SAMN05216569_1563 [Pseudoxanthomonas sp. CF125]